MLLLWSETSSWSFVFVSLKAELTKGCSWKKGRDAVDCAPHTHPGEGPGGRAKDGSLERCLGNLPHLLLEADQFQCPQET